ncbi:MAG: hypothetical protein LBQ37_02750 [Elusimicrobiota bacterium]|jgi:hypothetical protein|nr:hypothetical protein [Elusimicrobiota bacterium]
MNEEKTKKKSKGFFARLFGADEKNDGEINISKEHPNAYLTIDYPIENEIISGLSYVLRIGASNDGYVEISINDGEWNPCRFSYGYWWFDWGYFKPGNYRIKARMADVNGNTVLESKERRCEVC